MSFREFRTNLLIVGEKHSTVRLRMVSIVFLIPLTFLVRVLLVGISAVVNISEIWWMDFVYYTFFEVLPLSVLVILSIKSTNIVKTRPNEPLLK